MQRSQHGSDSAERRTSLILTMVALAVPCIVALMLVDLAISERPMAQLIAEAAQAEFASQWTATAPTQVAEPQGATRTAQRN